MRQQQKIAKMLSHVHTTLQAAHISLRYWYELYNFFQKNYKAAVLSGELPVFYQLSTESMRHFATNRLIDVYGKSQSVSIKWVAGYIVDNAKDIADELVPASADVKQRNKAVAHRRRALKAEASQILGDVNLTTDESNFSEIAKYRNYIAAHTDRSQAGPDRMERSFPTYHAKEYLWKAEDLLNKIYCMLALPGPPRMEPEGSGETQIIFEALEKMLGVEVLNVEHPGGWRFGDPGEREPFDKYYIHDDRVK